MSAELETADEACVFEQILDYLLKGAYPSNASKGQKLVIRRRAKDFQIIQGSLHYVADIKGSATKQVSLHILPLHNI